MELLQLRTFVAASKTLHFTRASEELGISQSAVSHQIISLERELGVSLFRRVKKTIILTTEGHLALKYASDMLKHADSIPKEIEKLDENRRDSLRVTARLRSLGNPFHEVRRKFLLQNPENEMYFRSAENYSEVIREVQAGRAEVGITARKTKPVGLTEIPYGEFRMIPVVGSNHCLAGKKESLSLSDLEDENWLLFDKGTRMRDFLDDEFAAQHYVPPNIYESNDGAVLVKQLIFGSGIGFLPGWAIADEIESGQLVELKLDVEIRIPIFLVVPETNRLPIVEQFLIFMKTKQLQGVFLSKSVSS